VGCFESLALGKLQHCFKLIKILNHCKMFVVNRFLTGSEVARILKHYESLTNMDSWYTENES
jgi:hypothetical protein